MRHSQVRSCQSAALRACQMWQESTGAAVGRWRVRLLKQLNETGTPSNSRSIDGR